MGGSHQGDGYDLFVSYARRDDAGGWLSGLVEILRQELGADRVFFDVDTVATMDDWRAAIKALWAAFAATDTGVESSLAYGDVNGGCASRRRRRRLTRAQTTRCRRARSRRR